MGRWSRLTLSKQVLVLIAVPAIVELVFVGALIYQLHTTSSILTEINNLRRFGSESDKVLVKGLEVSRFMDNNNIRNRALRYKANTDKVQEFLMEAEQLAEMAPNDTLRKHMATLIEPARHFRSVFSELQEAFRTGGIKSTFPIYVRERPFFESMKQDILAGLHDMLESRLTIEEQYEKLVRKQEESLRNLVLVVTLGTGFQLLAVLYCWRVFGRTVAEGFRRLVDNTNRFMLQKPLDASVKGNYEIEELNKVFIDMSAAVEEARRKEQHLQNLKKEYVAMVSHDLRSPLSSIQAILEATIGGIYGDISERAQNKLTIANGNTGRLIALINDLLDLEKMESGKLELELAPLAVRDVVDNSFSNLADFAARRGVKLVVDVPESLSVRADADRLEQVLNNLIANAVKFSPNNSTIHITGEQTDKSALIHVRDEGSGISPEQLPFIFDRFRQAGEREDRKGGAGLGLAICKAICEEHGGHLSATSEVGKGSTFTIELPLDLVLTGEISLTAP